MEQTILNARIRILFAARKLFAQHGFEATTVRQICKEAQLNLALVSYHFGGKESVFFALFDEFFPKDLFSLGNTPLGPVEGINAVIEKVVRFKIEQPEMVTIIQQEILMKSPRLKGMSKYMYPVLTKLKEFLEEGKKQHLFNFESIDNALIFIMSITTFPLSNAFINPLLSDKNRDITTVVTDICLQWLEKLEVKLH